MEETRALRGGTKDCRRKGGREEGRKEGARRRARDSNAAHDGWRDHSPLPMGSGHQPRRVLITGAHEKEYCVKVSTDAVVFARGGGRAKRCLLAAEEGWCVEFSGFAGEHKPVSDRPREWLTSARSPTCSGPRRWNNGACISRGAGQPLEPPTKDREMSDEITYHLG